MCSQNNLCIRNRIVFHVSGIVGMTLVKTKSASLSLYLPLSLLCMYVRVCVCALQSLQTRAQTVTYNRRFVDACCGIEDKSHNSFVCVYSIFLLLLILAIQWIRHQENSFLAGHGGRVKIKNFKKEKTNHHFFFWSCAAKTKRNLLKKKKDETNF